MAKKALKPVLERNTVGDKIISYDEFLRLDDETRITFIQQLIPALFEG